MWSLCLRSYLHNEFTDWLTDVLYCSSFLHETFCHRINSLLVLCGSTLRTFWNADANCSLFIITFITLIYWPNVWSKLNVSLTPHKDDTIPNWLSFKQHKFLETDRGTSWKRTTLRLLVNILGNDIWPLLCFYGNLLCRFLLGKCSLTAGDTSIYKLPEDECWKIYNNLIYNTQWIDLFIL